MIILSDDGGRMEPSHDAGAADGSDPGGHDVRYPATPTPARIIRANGAQQHVMAFDLPRNEWRIEGLHGVARDERILLLFPDGRAFEVCFRWMVGDQGGAVILR